MDYASILNPMGIIFLLIAVGFIASRLGLMTEQSGKMLTKLVIYITSPCAVLQSVFGAEIDMTQREVLDFLLISFAVFALSIPIAMLTARLLSRDKLDRGILSISVIFGNISFMGIPVCMALFGEIAVFYIALFGLPFNLFAWSAGVLIVSGGSRRLDPKTFLNPALVASVLAIILFFLNLKAPYIVSRTISILGDMTTPAAMLVIGSSLAGIPFKDTFSDWKLYPAVFLRLIAMPVIVWLIFRGLIVKELTLGVLVVLSAMPVAAITLMMAMEFGGNERLASKSIVISTLLSLITIPLLVIVLL